MWVLDNSVIVKWFFVDELLYEKSLLLQESVILKPNQFAIPTLCYAEFIHVLSRKSGYDVSFVKQSFDRFVRLGIRSFTPSTEALEESVHLACHGFSGYDATYLALAKELNGKWLTADLAAVKKDQHNHSIYLGDW